MIDFETMGTHSDCVVLSLGAVRFTRARVLDQGYWICNKQEQLKMRRTVSPETLTWWNNQTPDAKKVLRESEECMGPIQHVMSALYSFVDKEDRIWSNGVDFDVQIAEHLYRSLHMRPPWKYYNKRCYRTIKTMFQIEQKTPFTGVKHNALEDALYQAHCLSKYLQANTGVDL
jgi:hypothetical protein